MSDEGVLATPTFPWKTLRELGPEDGAAAADLKTGFNFYQKKDSCIDLYKLFNKKFAGIIISMYGDSYNGETCDNNDAFAFDLIGYREPLVGYESAEGFNPPIAICSAGAGLAITSAARASSDGGVTETGRWMDTLTLSNNTWPGTLDKFENGADQIAQVAFDSTGIRYIYPWVWNALGSNAGECPAVGMVITVY